MRDDELSYSKSKTLSQKLEAVRSSANPYATDDHSTDMDKENEKLFNVNDLQKQQIDPVMNTVFRGSFKHPMRTNSLPVPKFAFNQNVRDQKIPPVFDESSNIFNTNLSSSQEDLINSNIGFRFKNTDTRFHSESFHKFPPMGIDLHTLKSNDDEIFENSVFNDKTNKDVGCGTLEDYHDIRSKVQSYSVMTKNFLKSDMDIDLMNTESMPFIKNIDTIEPRLKNFSMPHFYNENDPALTLSANFSPLGTSKQGLVGDLSRPHTFPTIPNNASDLVYLSIDTMSSIIQNNFSLITSGDLNIIDCRYPYEYEGGHIIGAINLYSADQIIEHFFTKNKDILLRHENSNTDVIFKSPILIFHCEFSSQRAPKMLRFLRNRDRNIHNLAYPKLFYPEAYILEGGYKNFFNRYKDYCEPVGYVGMNDIKFSENESFYAREAKMSFANSSASLRGSLRPRRRLCFK